MPMTLASGSTAPATAPKIWWSNSIFFVSVHIAALLGLCYKPPNKVPWATLILAFLTWQLADFGITVGYHRLYSHKAFRANLAVRVVLAILGAAGFQGSIKWWCLRHRLHHRFTDDPIHDPYSATRGLFYSHMGWIFYKPTYERIALIDRGDLECDPVVRFQHRYYLPIALFFGFIMPPMLGSIWKDPVGALIWGGFIARLAIWHCTFLVNSLAHWDGLQPYSDDDTSRGNLILALLTGGEGNHNFHTFPHDFRSGPSVFDWDPSKWIIVALYRIGLAYGLRRARDNDVVAAALHMHNKTHHDHATETRPTAWEGQTWNAIELGAYIANHPGCCIIIIQGQVVDVTKYLIEHPGGALLLRQYSVRTGARSQEDTWRKASWAFDGGLNCHSSAAGRRLQELVVARYVE